MIRPANIFPGQFATPPMPNNPAELQRPVWRPRHADFLLKWSFLVMCAISFWNLNGIAFLVFSQDRIFSIILLVCGFGAIGRGMGYLRGSLTNLMYAYLTFMVIYVSVGMIQRFEVSYFISYVNSMFLTIAGAVAARALIARIGLGKTMGWITVLLCLGAWTVFLSPFLRGYYVNAGNSELSINAGRNLGFFANPNETGMAANLAAVACFACLTLPMRRYAFLNIALAASGFGAVLTFSRSALVTLAVTGIGYLGMTAQLGRRSVGLLISGGLLIGVSYWFFAGGYKIFEWQPEQLRRIQSMERIMTFQELESEDGIAGRMLGAQGGLDYWLESPWIGHGMGSLHRMPERFFGGLGCHNTHVAVLGESGVPGALAYLVFLMAWFAACWNCRQPSIRAFTLGIFFLFFAFGMVSHGVLDQRNMNVLMGICFGMLSMQNFVRGTHGPEYSKLPGKRRFAHRSY